MIVSANTLAAGRIGGFLKNSRIKLLKQVKKQQM